MLKTKLLFFVASFSLFTATMCGFAQRPETLGSVKKQYLNQQVVLIGPLKDENTPLPEYSTWYLASESAGRYREDDTSLPGAYKGLVATVTAIQLDREPSYSERVNALGELTNFDDTVNPDIDIVVRFDDGQMAMTNTSPSIISGELRFASAQSALAQEMTTKLPSILGKSIYACGSSTLYMSDTTLGELLDLHRVAKEIKDKPYLVPLKVTAAKYYETKDSVVLKVKLPDGRDALTIANGEELTDTRSSFVERVSGYLLSAIPPKFTPREIAAIRKQAIFRGMNKDALFCSMGYPESTNDWGRGGKQLVYTGSIMVYVDTQDRVVDWQSLGN